MRDRREAYRINGRTYEITSEPSGYKVWVGGSALSDCLTTLERAREILHIHAVAQNRSEHDGYQERMLAAAKAVIELGDDPFNLGRFRVPDDARAAIRKADGLDLTTEGGRK